MNKPFAMRTTTAEAIDRWEELRPGVNILILHDHPSGSRHALLRYRAGASVPAHVHGGDEHIYVLEGSQSDENGVYTAGTYVFNSKGSIHSVTSPEGCLVFIHWAGPIRFLSESPLKPPPEDLRGNQRESK